MSESRCMPAPCMSFRYFGCLSFTSPNMRSSSTRKADDRVSGVRSSCDMLAENPLVRFRDLRARGLLWISLKSRTFSIAIAPWSANVVTMHLLGVKAEPRP